jgi:hypothetical protein
MKQFMPIFAFAIALALILAAASPADAKPCGRGHIADYKVCRK